MREPPKIFDVAVLGTGVGGLIAATQLANEKRSVLLLKEDRYQLSFKKDGYCFVPFSNFSERRVRTDLLKKIPFSSYRREDRRQAEKSEQKCSVQLILPEARIDLYQTFPLLQREWRREFPKELNPIENFYAELGRIYQSLKAIKSKEGDGSFFPICRGSLIKRWYSLAHLPKGRSERWLSSFSPEFKKCIELQVITCGNLLADSFPISLISYLLIHEEEGISETNLDLDIMIRSLLEGLIQSGGWVEEIRGVEKIEGTGMEEFFISLTGEKRDFRAQSLILNSPYHRLSHLFGKRGKALSRWNKKIRPRYVMFPFFLGLREKVIPVGMGDLLISILNLEKPYEGGNLLLLGLSRKGDERQAPEGKRALTAQCFIPLWKTGKDISYLQDGVIHHLKHLFPFLEDHIELIEKDWANDQIGCWSYPHYLYQVDSDFQWRDGIIPIQLSKNLYFSGRENFPYLGLEGEVLSGIFIGEEISKKYR